MCGIYTVQQKPFLRLTKSLKLQQKSRTMSGFFYGHLNLCPNAQHAHKGNIESFARHPMV